MSLRLSLLHAAALVGAARSSVPPRLQHAGLTDEAATRRRATRAPPPRLQHAGLTDEAATRRRATRARHNSELEPRQQTAVDAPLPPSLFYNHSACRTTSSTAFRTASQWKLIRATSRRTWLRPPHCEQHKCHRWPRLSAFQYAVRAIAASEHLESDSRSLDHSCLTTLARVCIA